VGPCRVGYLPLGAISWITHLRAYEDPAAKYCGVSNTIVGTELRKSSESVKAAEESIVFGCGLVATSSVS
jgi:hypothetical protein